MPRFIAPRTGAEELTLSEDQEEYKPVTVAIYRNSNYPGSKLALCRLRFTDEERAQIFGGEDLFIAELLFPDSTGAARFTPLTVDVGMQHWKVNPESGEADGTTNEG